MKLLLIIIFTLAVFLPLSFGDLGPIKEFRWIEWMAPIIFLILLVSLFFGGKSYFPSNATLFYTALFVISVWSIVNYIRNPVSGQVLSGAKATEVGLRAYYWVFIGVLTFFSSLWFFRYKKINEKGWLLFIIIFSLSIGLLRLLSYFGDFTIPYLYGTFRYGGGSSLYHRIGGLSDAAIPALAALFAYYYRRKWNVYFVVGLAICLTLLFFSGGRASFFGVLLGLTLYFLLIERKALGGPLLAILVLLILYFFVALYVPIPSQLERIFDVSGGVEEQDVYRFRTFQHYWSIFKQNPVFGKGIGYYQVSMRERGNISEFVLRQLVAGGHGAYYSTLAMFGIGGMFFLLTMLLASIHCSYRAIKNPHNQLYKRLMVFAFIYLLILSVEFYAGGKGYSHLPLYFLAGMTAGIAGANKETIGRIAR